MSTQHRRQFRRLVAAVPEIVENIENADQRKGVFGRGERACKAGALPAELHAHGGSLPFFVSAIYSIAQTDLALTVPRGLAKITAGMAGVRVVEPPGEIKAFPYFMAWHPRLSTEPAHRWFREHLRMAAQTI